MNYSNFSDKQKFAAMRCLNPGAKTTTVDSGWYRVDDSCNCDSKYANISGRGLVPCTFGVQTDQESILKSNPVHKLMTIDNTPAKLPFGAVYPQTQFVPSPYEPRQLSRIGNDYRSAWA